MRSIITCCKDCTARHTLCHASCTTYLAQKKELEKTKREQYILTYEKCILSNRIMKKKKRKTRSERK